MTAGPVPLVIGVTGHRDLVAAEKPLLEAAVTAFFEDLRKQFPDLPLLVITPLAEGADRLVARVAQRLGIGINILLPMPRALYAQDFETVSAEVFEEMLNYGEVIELPVLADPLPGHGLEGTHRDAQYEFLGIYLAAHCHVLLALWDGKPSPAPGGTAHVIRFHHENELILISGDEPRSAIDFSEDESDLAYHVACSRRDTGGPTEGLIAGQGRWLTRDDVEPESVSLPRRYRAVFRRQSLLNRDLARHTHASLAPTPSGGPAETDGRSAAERDVGDLFLAADALAVRFQRRALWSLRSMYAFAALAGLSFIVYADFYGNGPVIWLYLLFLALGFSVYLLERAGAWYRRSVDYRCLAEGLRVQYYWGLAGVRQKAVAEFPHDKFMKRQDLELGWIRNVMRYAARRVDAAADPVADAAVGEVIGWWLGDDKTGQTRYYQERMWRGVRHDRFTHVLSGLGFAVGLVAAVILALYQDVLDGVRVNLLIALMAGMPFLAAVRSSYAQRISERELIAQYAHMHRIYGNAQRLLARSDNPAQRRAILLALGIEALDEVGLWLLRQRERPVAGSQLFHGG